MSFYGTIKASSTFNDAFAAEWLENAMKGRGCDKNRILEVLTTCNNAQRQMIRTPYKTKYGKDLVQQLKKELSGDFQEVILALMETETKYDVMQLRKAVKGLGTNEKVLIELICSRTHEQLAAIKNEYQNAYGRTLEGDVVGDTSGLFQKILVSLLQANRDQSNHTDPIKAAQDAKRLYEDGEKRFGTETSTFRSILLTQNFKQLDLVFDEYEKLTGHDFTKAIEGEFSGDTKTGFLTIIKCMRNKPAYFAEELYKAMKGFGTRDHDLIRIIVSRSEIDLALIREEFEKMYKKSLIDYIKSETSGAYRDALIAIVKGN